MFHGQYLCLSVCMLDTLMSPAEMDEPIDIMFGVCTLVDLVNHVLDGARSPTEEPLLGVILNKTGHVQV